jgi:hypothetical protein
VWALPQEIDTLKHLDGTESRHLVVLRRGRWYVLECYHDNGRLLSAVEFESCVPRPRRARVCSSLTLGGPPHCIRRQLMWILADADSPRSTAPTAAEAALAAMTAENRTVWANARAEYFSSGINHQSLEMIERAIFVLSLDHEDHLSTGPVRGHAGQCSLCVSHKGGGTESGRRVCVHARRRRLLGDGAVALPRGRHQPLVGQVIQPHHFPQRQGRPPR